MKRIVPIVVIPIIIAILIVSEIYIKNKYSGRGPGMKDTAKQGMPFAGNNDLQANSELSGKRALREGDIIFQTSRSGQSKAIQLATHSEYSHCGIIYKNGNDYFVFEAVEPVRLTPLNVWISRGRGGHYAVKRLKGGDHILTVPVLQKMRKVGEEFAGKHYDAYFEWSDERIYCSELIWKIYKRATGVEVGKLEKLGDFDLTSAAVRQKMRERYGDRVPLDETVISPVSIFNSPLLEKVGAE